MKVIRKSDMVRNGQEAHLRGERDFLVAAEGSQWIIPLICAFQDTEFLYLVMPFCVGGDFLGVLIRKNILSEEHTKWFIAEMILCVEETHKMGWIHRDIKPDNFLIGADGHLKISDFGLAFDGHWSHDQKFYQNHRHDMVSRLGVDVRGDEQDKAAHEQLSQNRKMAHLFSRSHFRASKYSGHHTLQPPSATNRIVDWRTQHQTRHMAQSIVGTSQYMAPEVIRGERYDGRCDWWSIAVIMYECLYGYTPFVSEDRQITKLKILKHRETLEFPDPSPNAYPSLEALDLMQSLLVERGERLSTCQYVANDDVEYSGRLVYPDDAEDIKRHEFFGPDWSWTGMQQGRPPFVPFIKHTEDTKYFDEEEVSDVAPPSEGTGGRQKTVHQKRARDQILRDEVCGKTALAVRVRGAFLGYAYHSAQWR